MNPVPLKCPNGLVYAFICSSCHQVGGSFDLLGRFTGPNKFLVDSSYKSAESCCTCQDCHVPLASARDGRCETCEINHKSRSEEQRILWLKEKSLRDETVQNSLALSLNREAAERLYSLMSGLSEQYWCSGWLSNLEHILWRYVVKREESKYRFSLAYISSEDVDKLLDLSEKAGGWWAYTDEPIRVSRFYPMKEWLEMYKEPKFEDPSED